MIAPNRLLAAAALIAFASIPARAQTATFDDLPSGFGTAVPTGYTVAGLNWNNFYAFDATGYGGSNTTGCIVTSPNCVFNGGGSVSSLTSATPFDLTSAYFMGWYSRGNYGNPVTLQVDAYLASVLQSSQTLVLNTSATQNYLFNFSGVDEVVFTTNGNEGGAWYAGDNFVFNENVVATPEPASLALLATGLVCVGGIVRRRRTSSV